MIFLAPDRKFAGCAMALVSATEVIAAITAMAEAEKSEWQSVRVAPLQSVRLLNCPVI